MIFYIILYAVPILFVLAILEKYRVTNLDLKAENAIRKVRNDLRLAAINNPRIMNDSGFQRIDWLIAATEKHIKNANLWVLMYKFYAIKTTTKKPDILFGGNHELKKHYDEFREICARYLLSKNVFFVLFIFGINLTTKGLSKKVRGFVERVQRDATATFYQQELQYY
jgi:hypothetical protein